MTKKKAKKKVVAHKQVVRDPRYKTDVLEVRQEIRAVYRSLPHDDFVKLVNFLLRGIRFMKHSPPERSSWWHADDPTFKHTMGEKGRNPYTRQLLLKMGFVCIRDKEDNEVAWVWPSLHLRPGSKDVQKNTSWGDKIVPANCPGKTKDRLDDMIMLLRNCQLTMNQNPDTFNGHFS